MMRFRNITLGGEFAISYRIGLIAIPLLIITVPLTDVAEKSSGSFFHWTLAAIVGTLVAVIGLITVDKTIWANRRIRPVSNYQLFLIGGILGAIKGAITEVAAAFLGVEGITLTTILERTISSASIGSLAIPLIALMEFSLNANKRLKIALDNEIPGINDLLDNLDNSRIEDQFLTKVRTRIENIRVDLVENFLNKDKLNNEEVSLHLSKIANELIRPLSHDATNVHKKLSLGRYGWREVNYRLPNAIAVGLPWIIAVYIATSARVQLQLRGLNGGAFMLVLDVATLYLSIYIFIRINAKGRFTLLKINTSLILAIFFHTAASYFIALFIFGNYKLNFALNVFWTAFTIAEVSIASLYLTHELNELDKLEQEYSSKFQTLLRFTQGQSKLIPTLARYLHGTMQNRIITSANRIKKIEDDSEIRKELAIVLDNLQLPDKFEDKFANKSAEEMFTEIVSLWVGLITIEAKDFNFSKIDSQKFSDICEILNEGISNAFRHGGATEITLRLKQSGNSDLLEIIDNGFGFGEVVPGLGSLIYSRSSESWNLARVEEQTILSAVLRDQPAR